MYGVPHPAAPPSMSPESEPHVNAVLSPDMDASLDAHSAPTYASFDTLNVRRKDQKGQTRYRTKNNPVGLPSQKYILIIILCRIKCLMIGYHDGFQIWDVSNPDNIHELCSVRDEDNFADVTAIHSLATPRKDRSAGKDWDPYEKQRPLIAIV
jgi:hypothetical protein